MTFGTKVRFLVRLMADFEKDSGGLYNYFITDFVRSAREVRDRLGEGADYRVALMSGAAEAAIGLSAEVEAQLDQMKAFLRRRVFQEPRVFNRSEILHTLTRACLDLLSKADALRRYVRTQAAVMNIRDEKLERAEALLAEPVHCIQLWVGDIFSQMSDQEIYDL